MNSVYIGSLQTQGACAGLFVRASVSSKNYDLFIRNIHNIQNNTNTYIFNSAKLQYILIGKGQIRK